MDDDSATSPSRSSTTTTSRAPSTTGRRPASGGTCLSRLRLQLRGWPDFEQHLLHRHPGCRRLGSGAGQGRGSGTDLHRRTHRSLRRRPQPDQQALPRQPHQVLPDSRSTTNRRRGQGLGGSSPGGAPGHAGQPGRVGASGPGDDRRLTPGGACARFSSWSPSSSTSMTLPSASSSTRSASRSSRTSPSLTNDGRPKRWVVVRPRGAADRPPARARRRRSAARGDRQAGRRPRRVVPPRRGLRCRPRAHAQRGVEFVTAAARRALRTRRRLSRHRPQPLGPARPQARLMRRAYPSSSVDIAMML